MILPMQTISHTMSVESVPAAVALSLMGILTPLPAAGGRVRYSRAQVEAVIAGLVALADLPVNVSLTAKGREAIAC